MTHQITSLRILGEEKLLNQLHKKFIVNNFERMPVNKLSFSGKKLASIVIYHHNKYGLYTSEETAAEETINLFNLTYKEALSRLKERLQLSEEQQDDVQEVKANGNVIAKVYESSDNSINLPLNELPCVTVSITTKSGEKIVCDARQIAFLTDRKQFYATFTENEEILFSNEQSLNIKPVTENEIKLS